MSEIEMHYGEAVLWIEALEWYIREHGLTVPTWADVEQAGWQPAPKPQLSDTPKAIAPGIVAAREQRRLGLNTTNRLR